MHSRYGVAGVIMSTWIGLAYPAHSQLDQPSQLAVEISGLNEAQGQVCLNLFNSNNGFPNNREEAVQTLCVATAEDSPLTITFEDLTPGSYAVSVYHDANSNNEFDRNFVGMPTEGFGFSQNPDVRTGPPNFGEAVFLVAGSDTQIAIELSYF